MLLALRPCLNRSQLDLNPILLDLGIALAAGAVATYAKVNPGAVSSMAGTAIAVALGSTGVRDGIDALRPRIMSGAQGAALLYAANLLGILIGGISVLAIREPYFREKLRAPATLTPASAVSRGLGHVLVGQKLYEKV